MPALSSRSSGKKAEGRAGSSGISSSSTRASKWSVRMTRPARVLRVELSVQRTEPSSAGSARTSMSVGSSL
jgi:hypothetical protein